MMARYSNVKLMLAKNMKRLRTYSICIESKKAMLVWWVEKPPVPMVENAWQMASNGVMPTKYKLTAQAIVRKK